MLRIDWFIEWETFAIMVKHDFNSFFLITLMNFSNNIILLVALSKLIACCNSLILVSMDFVGKPTTDIG